MSDALGAFSNVVRQMAWLAALTLAGSVSAGTSVDSSPVKATLLADRVPAGTGDVVRVGALLTLEPGWHVYWRNPGGAGLATELTVEVPGGEAVGAVEWPLPISFTQPGEIAGYGYEGSVLLARAVRVGSSPVRPIPVRARASWLACKDVCVLGEARLQGSLGGSGVTVDPTAFARRVMPRPVGSIPAEVSVTRGGEPGEVTVWLRWREVPDGVEWFPAPVPGLEVSVRRVATRAGLTRVDLGLRRVGEEPPGDVLPAVVVVSGRVGSRTGHDLAVAMK